MASGALHIPLIGVSDGDEEEDEDMMPSVPPEMESGQGDVGPRVRVGTAAATRALGRPPVLAPRAASMRASRHAAHTHTRAPDSMSDCPCVACMGA